MTTRKSIHALPDHPLELEKIRDAFRHLMNSAGDNGYQKLAGIHGVPEHLCKHVPSDEGVFLAWHRAYILNFEKALQQIDASVYLPYWDWTELVGVPAAIPLACTDKTYDAAGTPMPNPFFAAKIALEANRLTTRGTYFSPTSRYRALQAIIQNTLPTLTSTSYEEFNTRIASLHGDVHGWVGGDMRHTDYAAYDPIFWMLHAGVDYLWAKWAEALRTHLSPDPPPSILDKPLAPFEVALDGERRIMKVADVLQTAALGYTYAGIGENPALIPILNHHNGAFHIENFSIGSRKIFIKILGLRVSAESFFINIFINQPDADFHTPLEGNDYYATSFAIFGMGNSAHHNLHHHALTADIEDRWLDISASFNKLLATGKLQNPDRLEIKLVAVDGEEKPVDISRLPFQGVSIETR
ncbi:MAG: tyrosinase family protein [Acidobacteria bacterium]|nr:tyrosinase family protein [Acidobacteriota bacterium]